MAFCSKCGKELAGGAQFCASCGAPVNSAAENDGTKRVQKFVGEIRKCPSCGTVLESFQGVCPSCGFELNNVKVNNTVKEFFEKLQNYAEENVTEFDKKNDEDKKYAKTWTIYGSVVMFFAGAATFCLDGNPFVGCILILLGIALCLVFLLFPYSATESDKKKKSLIEGFVVPNDAESIMEFLILSLSQIDSSAKPFGSAGKEKQYWNKIWKVKANQTIQKAKLSLSENSQLMEKINAIVADLESRKNINKIKKFFIDESTGKLKLVKLGIALAILAVAGFVIYKIWDFIYYEIL